jgi:hypothetical protein
MARRGRDGKFYRFSSEDGIYIMVGNLTRRFSSFAGSLCAWDGSIYAEAFFDGRTTGRMVRQECTAGRRVYSDLRGKCEKPT